MSGAIFGFDWATSLLLLAPLPLIVLANVGVRHEWARLTTYIACGLIGCALLTFAMLSVALAALQGFQGALARAAAATLALVAGAVLIGVLIIPAVRRQLARVLPLDPSSPVHLLALVLITMVAAFQLWLQLGTDILGAAGSLQPVSKLDLIGQELPLLLIGLAGVGVWLRRTPVQAALRIGWVVPRWWQIAIALLAAGIFFAIGTGFDYLGHQLTPGLAHKVDVANQHLMGGLGDPLGIATVALAAGICEEALFRGALQPRVGILVTATVFALVHTQYGLSFDSLAVLVLGCGLGLLRRHFNTTSSTVTHVSYNVLAGTGLPGPTLLIAVAVGILLLVAIAFGLMMESRVQKRSVAELLLNSAGPR